MEVLVKLNPIEAKTAINTGTLSALIDAVHAAEAVVENEIRSTQQPQAQPVAPIQQAPAYAQGGIVNTPGMDHAEYNSGSQQNQFQQQPQFQQPQYQQPAPQYQQPMQQYQQPTQQQPVPAQAQPQQAVPTSAPSYSFEQLGVAATQLVDAGRRQDVQNLLNAFGVQALTALPKEQYGAFATQLRAMGAKI
jgi:hypothetical protein